MTCSQFPDWLAAELQNQGNVRGCPGFFMVMGDLPLSAHPHHGMHEKKATVSATGMGCAPNFAVVAVIAAEPVGLTPVVVATAQVEGPTVPSSAVVAGERAVSNLAAAKERVDEREDMESCSHFRFIFGCYSSLRKV
jgi:hypothetical protein